MSKLWGALVLLLFLTEGNARIIDVSTGEEESPETGFFRHDIGREGRNDLLGIRPQDEKDDTTSVLSPSDVSAAGGGLRLLDPKFLDTENPLPPPDAPWWELWWYEICAWFSGAE